MLECEVCRYLPAQVIPRPLSGKRKGFMTVSKRSAVHEHHLLVALFPTQREAKKAVERLIDRDFPMDMLSVLGKWNPQEMIRWASTTRALGTG